MTGPSDALGWLLNQRQAVIASPAILDFVPWPLLAVSLSRNEFAAACAHRGPPTGAERLECALNAIRTCNVGVVQFLFKSDLLRIDDVQRELLPALICWWTLEDKFNSGAGTVMCGLMCKMGLDLISPIGPKQQILPDIFRYSRRVAEFEFLRKQFRAQP